jgi:hypothetical protein
MSEYIYKTNQYLINNVIIFDRKIYNDVCKVDNYCNVYVVDDNKLQLKIFNDRLLNSEEIKSLQISLNSINNKSRDWIYTIEENINNIINMWLLNNNKPIKIPREWSSLKYNDKCNYDYNFILKDINIIKILFGCYGYYGLDKYNNSAHNDSELKISCHNKNNYFHYFLIDDYGNIYKIISNGELYKYNNNINNIKLHKTIIKNIQKSDFNINIHYSEVSENKFIIYIQEKLNIIIQNGENELKFNHLINENKELKTKIDELSYKNTHLLKILENKLMCLDKMNEQLEMLIKKNKIN